MAHRVSKHQDQDFLMEEPFSTPLREAGTAAPSQEPARLRFWSAAWPGARPIRCDRSWLTEAETDVAELLGWQGPIHFLVVEPGPVWSLGHGTCQRS
jgi:hypothetical protein